MQQQRWACRSTRVHQLFTPKMRRRPHGCKARRPLAWRLVLQQARDRRQRCALQAGHSSMPGREVNICWRLLGFTCGCGDSVYETRGARRARRADGAQELVTARVRAGSAKAHTRSGTKCWSPKQARLVSAGLNLAVPRADKGAGAFYRLLPATSGGHHLRTSPSRPRSLAPAPPGRAKAAALGASKIAATPAHAGKQPRNWAPAACLLGPSSHHDGPGSAVGGSPHASMGALPKRKNSTSSGAAALQPKRGKRGDGRLHACERSMQAWALHQARPISDASANRRTPLHSTQQTIALSRLAAQARAPAPTCP